MGKLKMKWGITQKIREMLEISQEELLCSQSASQLFYLFWTTWSFSFYKVASANSCFSPLHCSSTAIVISYFQEMAGQIEASSEGKNELPTEMFPFGCIGLICFF